MSPRTLVTFCVICLFPSIAAETRLFRVFKALKADGTSFVTLQNVSTIRCAVECSSQADCDVAIHRTEPNKCRLFRWYQVTIQSPHPSGSTDELVIFSRPISVLHVRAYNGWTVFTFAEAGEACASIGGSLATYNLMSSAYFSGHLHVGHCAYISSGDLYYVMQYQVDGLGYAGRNSCNGWKSHGNAFCTFPGVP